MSPKYAFIGDIHSQSEPLAEALRYCRGMGITPIFLGDVFNSKELTSRSADVYWLLREAEKNHGAVVLQSNHQALVQDAISRGLKPASLPRKEVARTLRDFEESGVPLNQVLEWLNSLPYAISVRDTSGKEYRAAHAEIPSSVSFPVTDGNLSVIREVSSAERDLLLWGKPYSLPNSQRFWWLRKCKNPWITVAGHYHRVVVKEGFMVLDAGCGERIRAWDDYRESALVLFDVEASKLVYFPTQGGKTFEERVMV